MRLNLCRQQIPWAMAAVRAALGPVLIAGQECSWNGMTLAGIVIAALVSDIFDGVLARRWDCDTAAVRLFDSMTDTVFYVCVAIALWMGEPQVWRHNAGLLAALVTLEAMRFGLDFVKFGKPASYHSYLAKSWGLVMAIAVVAVFVSQQANPLLSVVLVIGIVCDMEGLAMSLMLPVWRKDVKTIWIAWRLRGEMGRSGSVRGRRIPAGMMVVIGGVFLLAATEQAFAAEPVHAVYTGGSVSIGKDTEGALDTTSPTALVFKFAAPGGGPGEVGIDYAGMRSFEYHNEVAHHLGVLPAIAVGLVARRERRYFFTITYADPSAVTQVAIFEVSRNDVAALRALLQAKTPGMCPKISPCKAPVR
jgi:phosphatidylglycerophosphate synthase